MSRYVPRVMKFGPWVTIVFSVITLSIIATVVTTRYLTINFYDRVNLNLIKTDNPDTWTTLNGVVLLANIRNMDLNAQTISVSWSIVCACGATYTGQGNNSCFENSLSVPMNLYFNLVPAYSWNISTPAGQYDPSMIQAPPPSYYLPGRHVVPTIQFDTVMSMDPFLPYTLDKKSSTLYYPFDMFTTYISIMAINPVDNSTIPIAYVIAYGTAVNWIGTGSFQKVTPPNGSPLYSIILQQKRQGVIKVFAIFIVVTNWMLSITVLWMTIIVLFRQKIDSGLLLASVTVLFALPQIRASMPDAPTFGTFIDIGGYFMNLGLVSVCTSALLLTQLRYRYYPPQTSGNQATDTTEAYQLLP